MIKLVSSIAMASMMTLALGSASQAQEQTMRRITSGQAAPLQKAMTQSQARRACQTEMQGSRESKSALRTKMNSCIDGKMQGN
ncbi:hypothetical protein [Bosea lathyri]|jgi:Ni/Co efflux regulator RcnB|uniref:PsiF repeat-containing protein n=1 Tax=Bosea lathyri TaxID=1036778 RepID=A0A1H5SS36_9HYPH|nr:hypothetical protein [Bosea lathyri]SEF52597.1 hypothetical protein SAMN04488115_101367 [Bosea lathyri]